MGCGRGYATFALHAALRHQYPDVRSRGIDVRPKLVREISTIAANLGLNDTLRFETGTIASFLAEEEESNNNSISSSNNNTLDVLIALHACDTATDDALWSGIRRQARILVVAPCCHRQVRPQLNRHADAAAAAVSKQPPPPQHPYADLLRHNIYRERLAETVTDALRALLLEYAGYRVQVFEFIGGEHTSKNVMITAVKQATPKTAAAKQQQQRDGDDDDDELLQRIRALASLHGIREQKLAGWMGIDLGSSSFSSASTSSRSDAAAKPRLSARSMPPLQK